MVNRRLKRHTGPLNRKVWTGIFLLGALLIAGIAVLIRQDSQVRAAGGLTGGTYFERYSYDLQMKPSKTRTPRGRPPTLTPTATLPGGSSTPTQTLTPSLTPTPSISPTPSLSPTPGEGGAFVLLSWNDLGMHCYNRDFTDIAVLPPFNTLYAQVVRRGDPPQIVTQDLQVSFSFPDNTYSVGKSNFWTYAQALFNLPAPLPPNIGLTGTGLAGTMELSGDHFVAEGIPLTEFRDSNPTEPYPYQLAEVVAKDGQGQQLSSLTVVAPVSTEMHCELCHSDGMLEGISTGKVETNILALHDKEHGSEYPAGFSGGLMANRPVLCAECHRSNALAPYGVPGKTGIPNLSKAMHAKHAGEFTTPNTQAQCYACHPGPQTKCLRDVMSVQYDMDCIDCHGGMEQVAAKTQPWLQEPRCDSCHTEPQYRQDNALYRLSRGHGGLFCAACHDSPHAVAPSREANDSIKFVQLQGSDGPLGQCTLCHLTQPAGTKVHAP